MTSSLPAHLRCRPHPWHGLEAGDNPPGELDAFVEMTPLDHMKYELDKRTGFLRIDRPQHTSSAPPAAYGFVPRTLCGDQVAALGGGAQGDGDPLDIFILSERPILRNDIVVPVFVIGGMRTLDSGEVDDKLVGVVRKDPVWGEVRSIRGLPPSVLDRLVHYLTTYKISAGANPVTVSETYDRDVALMVVTAALADYRGAAFAEADD